MRLLKSKSTTAALNTLDTSVATATPVTPIRNPQIKSEAAYYVRRLTVMAEIGMIINCLLVYALARPITQNAQTDPAHPHGSRGYQHGKFDVPSRPHTIGRHEGEYPQNRFKQRYPAHHVNAERRALINT